MVAAILAATVCFVLSIAQISALGREHSAPVAALIGLAALFAIAAALLVWVAIRLEHRFRSSFVPARATTPAPHPATVRHPRNGPASRIISAVIVVGAVVLLALLTLNLHSQASRSQDTQAHGLSRHARVVSVRTINNDTRYDSWITYDYVVALTVPAGTVRTTVVHDPTRDFQEFDPGDSITVLVDPHQLSYAELPGLPVESRWWFVGPLTLGLIFLGLAALLITEEIKHRRLRAAQPRESSAPGGAQ
jgi:hypothetical protein